MCVALGDFVVSLTRLASRFPELFPGPLLPSAQAADVFARPSLNPFLALGRPVWSEVRSVLQRAFAAQSALRDVQDLIGDVLVPHDTVTMHLPVVVGDYTDFYSSRQHATNVGTMFRGKDNALPPNWLHMPIGYHGRASSVVVSGTNVVRPCGQLSPDPTAAPTFGPCKLLDFELEMATIIGGPGNPLGKRVRMEEAGDAVFGFALMNDWSARDIQKWEYVPLGPFGAKNFATTMSPWIVTLEALQPFREPAPVQDPAVLPYLRAPTPAPATVPHAMDVHCLYNIDLSVSIKPSGAKSATSVCASNFRNLYWTVAQQITHHTVTGCNVRPGDLMASGTISGAERTYLFCIHIASPRCVSLTTLLFFRSCVLCVCLQV